MPIKVSEKDSSTPQPANPKTIVPGSSQDYEQRYLSMATTEFNNNFIGLLRTRTTTIYVSTNEEKRFVDYLYNVSLARGYEAFEWDCFRALRKLKLPDKITVPPTFDLRYPEGILGYIIEELEKRQKKKEDGNGAIYLCCDFYRYLSPDRCSPPIERQLKYINRLTTNSHVILTGPSYISNPALEKEIAVLDFPFPNEEEIRSILWGLVKSEKVQSGFPTITKIAETQQEELINSAKGLTTTEAIQAYSKSIVMSKPLNVKPLDINLILQEKKQIIKKTDVLEYVDSHIDMKDVGGLDDLVHWLNLRKVAFMKDAIAYGLKPPRGALLLGMPGCGKSLTAKAAATLYEMPLLRLDFGKMFNSLVGESEKIARQAIKLAETVAPCVSGDSVVYDNEGRTYKVSDLLEEDFFKDRNFYTYSFNEESWKVEKTRVRAVIRHPKKKEMIRLVTAIGSVEVTPNHKMMINRDGKLIWEEAKNLKKTDLLITQKQFKRDIKNMTVADVFPDKKTEETLSVQMQDQTHTVTLGGSLLNMIQLAALAGLVESCGVVNAETGEIMLHNDNIKVAHLAASLFSACFLVEPAMEGKTLQLTNKIIAKLLVHFIQNVHSQRDDVLIFYLSGFMHASAIYSYLGTDKIPYINLRIPSKDVKHRVRTALHILGIIAFDTGENLSVLEKEQIEDLLIAIPFLNKNVADKLVDFMEATSKLDPHTIEIVGYQLGESISSVMKSNSLKKLDYHDEDITITDKHHKYIHHSMASKVAYTLAEQQLEVDENIEKLIKSDVVGVKLLSVETAGTQWAYDLSCENNHNFFANGLLCHNCILWADEIEKGLAGGVGQGSGDSGTTKRVIGTFLTWLQEKEAPVFVICTANNVHDIPPEFMRAGRFDEVFFVDLPSAKGRKQIFEVLLRKYRYDATTFDVDALAANTQGFSGAEIEKSIENAMFECFCDNKRQVKTNDLIASCKSISPLSSTRAEEFETMRTWAGGRCKFANTRDTGTISNNPSGEINSLDI